ncbi:MAG: PAS domain-containing protein [Paracoccaceae bacterium]
MNIFCGIADNVVQLSGVRTDMDFPAISEIRAYWEALRNGRPMPSREEIDPRGIEQALEFAFILERIAPRAARFRLSGRHLNALMGMEVRGMPITAFFGPKARDRASEIVDGVFTGPAIAELDLAAEQGLGRPPVLARLLLLPLRADAGETHKALGCLVSHGEIGRTPRRFAISLARHLPLATKTPPRSSFQPATGFAEPASAFVGPPMANDCGRAHLKLVKSES